MVSLQTSILPFILLAVCTTAVSARAQVVARDLTGNAVRSFPSSPDLSRKSIPQGNFPKRQQQEEAADQAGGDPFADIPTVTGAPEVVDDDDEDWLEVGLPDTVALMTEPTGATPTGAPPGSSDTPGSGGGEDGGSEDGDGDGDGSGGSPPFVPDPDLDGLELLQIYSAFDSSIYAYTSANGNIYLTKAEAAPEKVEEGPVQTEETETIKARQEEGASEDTSGGTEVAPTEEQAPAAAEQGIDTSVFFYATEGMIVGDFQERVLHMYSEPMESFGVSRIRLHREDEIPKTSVVVTLVPIQHPTMSTSILVAVTTNGGVYYLAACNIELQLTKLFLVKDEKFISVLESPEMKDVVTGGDVEECVLIGLTNGKPGFTEDMAEL